MEQSDESFYSYQPLDPLAAEIRLLQVLDISEHTNAIRCTLSHECLLPYGRMVSSSAVPVFSRPIYRALSYVWGDANKDGEIFIEGRRLRISTNLDTAIRYLYDDGHLQTRIWIDAVCVNQDDLAERSSQVLLMRRLYQNAQSVIIWLGTYPSISGLDKSFDLIEDLVEGAHDTDIDHRDEDNNDVWEPTAQALAKFEENLGDESLIWVARMISEDLFDRHSWWTRMWVVQELALSTKATVHRGHRCLQWRDIIRASKWIESQHERIFGGGYFEPILNLGQIRSRWVQGQSLSLQGPIIVRRLGENDLPSWVPDLKGIIDSETPRALLQHGNSLQIWNASASKTSLINWQATGSGHRSLPHLRPVVDDAQLWLKNLHLPCVVVDTISEVSSLALRPFAKAGSLEPWERTMKTRFGNPYSTKWSFSMQDIVSIFQRYRALIGGDRPVPEFRSTLAELKESQPYPDQYYISGGTVLEAWIRTILADQVHEYQRATAAEITAFCRCRCPPDFLQHLSLDIRDRVERFVVLLFHSCIDGTRGKRLVITEKGYIGTVPVEARQGDLVCVLIGCDVPTVLRRKSDQDDHRYILVCEAYVHGLMDGEAIQLLEDNLLGVQHIILE